MRLVILDEPFRGLDREQRRELLTRARSLWQHATLLCITHDVSETQAFARVLVVEGGQIVEDGPPTDITTRPESRYRAMLDHRGSGAEGTLVELVPGADSSLRKGYYWRPARKGCCWRPVREEGA